MATPLNNGEHMFENKNQRVIPLRKFIMRLGFFYGIGLLVLTIALSIGIFGFHWYEDMSWLNAFENSAMILSTMGPVIPISSAGGKMFAAFYALFSGLVFVTLMGVIFGPIIHRMLHKFHSEHQLHSKN